MDIFDKIKQFINESIQSLFVRQKDELSHIIHSESVSAVTELKALVSQQSQSHEREMANVQESISSLNQGVRELLTKLDAIQDVIDQLKTDHKELSTTENQVPPLAVRPQLTIYYAKMVDSLNPLGFKMDSLKNKEDGCAFKITLKDDLEGYYEIVEDIDIQQEILAAFNPLISDSSVYDIVPQSPTQINVIQPGQVVKEENLLRIVKKQIIDII